MSSFLSEKKHMREALLFSFNLKKSVAESHRMLVQAYDYSALSESACRDWFHRFKDGNFDLSDKKCENLPKNTEDHQLQSLLGPIAKNVCRAIGCYSTSHFHEPKCHGKVQKIGKWVPHELNDRRSASDCDWRRKVDIF